MGNLISNNVKGADRNFDLIPDTTSPEYWRQKGDELARARNEAFASSKAAYAAGDRARAGQLSRQGKEYATQVRDTIRLCTTAYVRGKREVAPTVWYGGSESRGGRGKASTATDARQKLSGRVQGRARHRQASPPRTALQALLWSLLPQCGAAGRERGQ
jgi:hypothetical protein